MGATRVETLLVFNSGDLLSQADRFKAPVEGRYHFRVPMSAWHTDGKPTQRGYEETRGLFVGGGPAVKDAVDWKGRPVTGYTGWVFQSDDGQKSPELGDGLTPPG